VSRLGVTFSGDLPFAKMAKIARYVESLDLHSVWVAEHYFLRDAFSTLAGLSVITKKLVLGTGIISPYTRHLGLIAMGAKSVSEISNGRFVLGIGTNARFLRQLGVEDESPLTTIKRSVDALGALLNGEEINLREIAGRGGRIRLGFHPPAVIPIYIGAIGPKMLRLAGQIADGVILSAGSSPSYIRKAIGLIGEGRKKNFEVVCYIMSIQKGDGKARALAKERLARLLSLPGREVIMGELASDRRIGAIRNALSRKGGVEAARLVGDDMLDFVSVSGSDKLEEFRRAGVTIPVISPIGMEVEKILQMFVRS
jgi:5,10-methylenetetrahydromethanopterin reductase